MAELARQAGVTRQTIWLLEHRGDQQPKHRTMEALVAALEVDRAWLFYVLPTVPVKEVA